MSGARVRRFFELREKFIFLMKHRGDVSPPWLEFSFFYLETVSIFFLSFFNNYHATSSQCLCDSTINTHRNYSSFCIVALKIAIMEGCQVIGPEKQAESGRG
jgi:hypothetical protein